MWMIIRLLTDIQPPCFNCVDDGRSPHWYPLLCLGAGRRRGRDRGGWQGHTSQEPGRRGQANHDPECWPHLGSWREAGRPDGQIGRPSSRSKSLRVTQAWTLCPLCMSYFCETAGSSCTRSVMQLTHKDKATVTKRHLSLSWLKKMKKCYVEKMKVVSFVDSPAIMSWVWNKCWVFDHLTKTWPMNLVVAVWFDLLLTVVMFILWPLP